MISLVGANEIEKTFDKLSESVYEDNKKKFHDILLSKGIQAEFIGAGNRGIAYKSGDKVYKFSKDPVEINSATKLIGKTPKHLIKYYSVEPLDDQWYLLKMDLLDKLTEEQEEIIELIQNSLGVQEYMLDPIRRQKFINELRIYPEYYEYIGTNLKTIQKILEQLLLIYSEAVQNDISTHDIRVDNLGQKDGKIIHFDLGAG